MYGRTAPRATLSTKNIRYENGRIAFVFDVRKYDCYYYLVVLLLNTKMAVSYSYLLYEYVINIINIIVIIIIKCYYYYY